MDPEEVKAPADADEELDDDDEDMEEEDDAECSEDESPERDPSVPVDEFLLDCSFEAIKICNIDFLTDFGSAEPFLIDGDSLVAYALASPYLNRKCGLQLLQVIHTIETTLARLMERGATFDIFFFEGSEVLWKELDPSCEFARNAVMQHFLMLNRTRELSGTPPLVRIHVLPGSWWDETNTALPALVDQRGPSFIMADFGWCGASGRALHLTRAFVNHLHLLGLYVVTLADFEVDGSHTISNNMQPPRHPRARAKIALAVRELLALHQPWLSAPPPPAAGGGGGPAAADAADVREAVVVGAMRHVAAACPDAGRGNLVAACIALALAQGLPLASRCFPFADEAFDRSAPPRCSRAGCRVGAGGRCPGLGMPGVWDVGVGFRETPGCAQLPQLAGD
jgi:hypothetical protein